MNTKKQTKTEQLLKVMLILAWVACVGFMVEAGAILCSFAVSCVNPEAAKNLYKGLNLFELRQFSLAHYTLSVFFLVVLPVMKSLVALQVIRILSKFNLQHPFTKEVAGRLEIISYMALGTWVVTMLSNIYTAWLRKMTGKPYGDWLSGEFIFMVALVFIMAQVFKRGVEIQSENDLTV